MMTASSQQWELMMCGITSASSPNTSEEGLGEEIEGRS